MESTSFCYYSPIHFWHRSRIRFLAPKSKKSEGRQELHSNLMFLMDSIGDLAPGAHLLPHLELTQKESFGLRLVLDLPEQGGAQLCIRARRLAPGGPGQGEIA